MQRHCLACVERLRLDIGPDLLRGLTCTSRQWRATPDWRYVVRPPLVETGYLARGVVSCATCNTAMRPGLWRAQRVYACTLCNDGRGSRVDAELIDSEVWTRLATERPALTRGVSGDERHTVISRSLRQVTVTNPYPLTLSYRGHDDPC